MRRQSGNKIDHSEMTSTTFFDAFYLCFNIIQNDTYILNVFEMFHYILQITKVLKTTRNEFIEIQKNSKRISDVYWMGFDLLSIHYGMKNLPIQCSVAKF